jgi:phosphatidylserine/phosphatidylglycerophosphate/cardiolipin synthase-like enzyme
VRIRITYNADDLRRVPVPAPPSTQPEILAELGLPIRGVGGVPDLMHHKYVVRDREAVWTGSMNWTLDSWHRQENVVLVVEAPELAAAFARNFEELWATGEVDGSGEWDGPSVRLGDVTVRPWFTPGRGEELAHRIAGAIGRARRRVRIASPVLTSGPVLGTLAEVGAERRADAKGVCDWTQLHAVFGQWRRNPRSHWKMPLLADVLESAEFTGKRSTPWAPGTTHDFMHAKVTVADDVVFAGSFNLSRSGELNAENVLEIHSPLLADALASYVDQVRARYPDVDAPS